MKILLVEDDMRTALFVINALKQNGFAVDHAVNGEDGLHQALTTSYDAAIVDIMLPKMDGLALMDELKRKKIKTPLIVLSAKRSVDDRIKGLRAGGDDYLVKPFAFAELLARIHALIRRAADISEPMNLTVGTLTIDVLRHKAVRSGEEIKLPPREYALLEYLMRNAGRVVSKSMIMKDVWNYSLDPQTNVVETRICRLRDKIDRNSEEELIHTIKGVGYLLGEKKQACSVP